MTQLSEKQLSSLSGAQTLGDIICCMSRRHSLLGCPFHLLTRVGSVPDAITCNAVYAAPQRHAQMLALKNDLSSYHRSWLQHLLIKTYTPYPL